MKENDNKENTYEYSGNLLLRFALSARHLPASERNIQSTRNYCILLYLNIGRSMGKEQLVD